ncbi:MAG: DNA gyrase subunit A [Oscillospiraceae bacterium]|nr:DNA gyrase subunit A [Oscillospiraceae bacterium]MDD6085124.1 DNA gyrase subunit A [Oscillospiraceae bacterium]MDY3256752.1 DNA gyrase subunit A [Ruminococcus callidus]
MRDKEVVVPVDIEKEMKKSFLEYSMSVIVARALPDVRDGLKPVHRRILYTMYENGLVPEGPYRKCADTVGSVLGKYHPHGDASVYDALVRLAQPFSLRYPLIDGQGNFGSVDGDPPAAYRYTEAKMKKLSMEMLADIKKETVPFSPNYDERLLEPDVLPSRFPNLLCNGSVGIAVGMATNIPPHNLGEVIDGIRTLIENPDCTLDDLMMSIKGPDFPTAGIIMGHSGIRSAYSTGRGKITLRAKTEFEKIGGRDAIVITEIPYMVNKARLVENIADLAKEKRVEGIHFVRDESGRQGMRIVVELKKDANPDIVLNKLFSFTQLQDTVGVNMLALVNGVPKCLSLKECLHQYLLFQSEVIRKRTEFNLRKAKEKAHILQGFCLAIDYIDEVISILRASSSIPEGKQHLIERFKDVDMTQLLSRAKYDLSNYESEQEKGITEEQAEAIVQMRLGALTGLEREKTEHDLYDLLMKITEYREILSDEAKVDQIILEELEDLRKRFGDDRRTEIQEVSGEVDIEDLIPNEKCVITFTNNGYIKRVPQDTYKIQKRGGVGISGMKQREEDYMSDMFGCMSHDSIMFVSNKGIMYKLKCYEIPDGSKASRGNNIVNFLSFDEDEKLVKILSADENDFDENHFVVVVTKNGKIKRTALSEYKNIRKSGLIAVGIDDGDEIVSVDITDGSKKIIIATRKGMSIKINETDARPMSRTAHGVRAINLREGDYVVGMGIERENSYVLTLTEGGYGRRTACEEYKVQGRGGLGLMNYKTDEIRGEVCGISIVDDTQDVIVTSTGGVVIRFLSSDVNVFARGAKGVKIMRFRNDGEKAAALLSIAHEEEKTEETTEENS